MSSHDFERAKRKLFQAEKEKEALNMINNGSKSWPNESRATNTRSEKDVKGWKVATFLTDLYISIFSIDTEECNEEDEEEKEATGIVSGPTQVVHKVRSIVVEQ